MGIEIDSRTWKPSITCDNCGKPINGIGEGNVIHSIPVRNQPVALAFVHKVDCDPRSNRAKFRCYIPLEYFLDQTKRSLKKRRKTSSKANLP